MMRKFLVFTLAVFLCFTIDAQRSIDGLINAEKSFAAYSVTHGTKEAFLKFADSAGIIFDQGKPVNAIETWNKREKRPGLLNWFPKFADISASGDLGYTSGPWTLSMNDSVIARGQYATVWHLNKNGEWKFLIDLGVNNTPIIDSLNKNSIDSTEFWRMDEWGAWIDPTIYHGSTASFLKAENKFIRRTEKPIGKKQERKYWYGLAASKNEIGVLHRNNRSPLVQGSAYGNGDDGFYATMRRMPEVLKYNLISFVVASSHDLGYVYGTTIINNKQDGYLRIWRREKTAWKIALEVLRY